MWKFIPLFGALFNFSLGLLVLFRGLCNPILRVYTLFVFSIATWNLGTYFVFVAHDSELALFWARFLEMGVIFVPITLYHLSLLIARIPIKRSIYFFYGFYISLVLSNITGCFISGVHNIGYSYYSVAGPGFYLYILALPFSLPFFLRNKLSELQPLHKSRVLNLLWAQIFLLIVGSNDILPMLGIYHYPGTNSIIHPLGSLAVAFYGVIIGFSVFRHRRLGDLLIDHDKILAFIESLQGRTDENQLLKELHELLLNEVFINNYQIILLDETAHYLKVFRSYPGELTGALSEFNTAAHIYHYFRKTQETFLCRPPCSLSSESPHGLAKARQQMAEFNAELCFAFRYQETCFGFILLGPKIHGETYSAIDLQLIGKLICHLSTTIKQIRLMNQLLMAQELELLGRMSRGMAHDLNNLLTPIDTYLQLIAENSSASYLNEELLPVALNNIKTIFSHIHESLFFSENLKPDFKRQELAPLLSKTVELVQPKLEAKKINVIMKIPDGLWIELDKLLIQRMFINLISNAADASGQGAEIQFTATLFDRGHSKNNRLQIQVIDHGTGITDENLNRVSSPYFTTKTSGDLNRGLGLGLTICRRIAHLHEGSMTFTNSKEKGTTVTIDLPYTQSNPLNFLN